MNRRVWGLAGAGLLFALFARTQCTLTPSAQAQGPIDVRYMGCRTVYAGPVCEIDATRPTPFVLWARLAPNQRGHLTIDGPDSTSLPTPTRVENGWQWRLALPPSTERLQLQDERRTLLSLSIRAVSVPAPFVAFEAKVKAQPKLAETELLEAWETLDAPHHAPAWRHLARARIRYGHVDEGLAALDRAAKLAQASGQFSVEAKAQAMAADLQSRRHAFTQAEHHLERLSALQADFPEIAGSLQTAQGMTAFETGRLWAAADHQRLARTEARRLNFVALEATASSRLSFVALAMGRPKQAMEALAHVPDPRDPCRTGSLALNRGWAAHLAERYARAERHYNDAQAHFETCERAIATHALAINRVLLALDLKDRVSARNAWEKLKQQTPRPLGRNERWRSLLRGRLALLEERPQDARTHFQTLERQASQTLDLAMGWRARVGQGQAWEALGDLPVAMAAYTQAEAGLDDESRLAPVTVGWSDFAAKRRSSGVHLVDLLYRMDRPYEALVAARRSLRRQLGSAGRRAKLALLDKSARLGWSEALAEMLQIQQTLETRERDRWKLSETSLETWQAEQDKLRQQGRSALDKAYAYLDSLPTTQPLSSPPPQTLQLVVHKGHTGYIAFGVTPKARKAVRIKPAESSPEAWSAALFAPFAEEIRRASRIALTLDPALDTMDVHALTFDERPLGVAAAVTYDLDLPDVPATPQTGLFLALDPRSDAQDAIPSAEAWSASDALTGPDATRDAILARLDTVDTFIFVGHGEVGDDQVTALRVADRKRITAMDIMALPKVPPVVILLACEAARTQEEGAESSVDLALHHAFLLAGSRQVIAAPRPLTTEVARRFLAHYLDARPSAPDGDRALQTTLQKILREDGQLALRQYSRSSH